jgi:hypothetical protein
MVPGQQCSECASLAVHERITGSTRVKQRQIVDLVLIWTRHSPQSTLMGDQMVKVLTAGGRGNGIPIGPVYFSRDYVRHSWLSNKTYPQGGRGVVLRVHKFLWRVTHVDLRLPDGEFLLEVPIDYVRTLD